MTANTQPQPLDSFFTPGYRQTMKILIVSDAWTPQVNGVVRTYEQLSAHLSSMGHTVKVIGPEDFPFRVPLPGYPEIELALFVDKRLGEMVDSFDPDHLHIATEAPLGFAARRYAIKRGKSFTTSYHTHFPDYVAKRVAKAAPFLASSARNIAMRTIRNFHAPAHAMMVATNSLENQLKSWDFKTPMVRLTRGTNLDIFRPGEKTKFNDLKRPVAICVARVAIEKSLETFLGMPWHGSKVLVGDGPDLAAYMKKYPDVTFTGKKVGAELGEYYRSGDVFVFPSRTDTFGMVLIEALASGLPVAAHDVTGPKDIITAPFLGALGEDLSQAAKEALAGGGTPEQRHQHVRENYTWEKAAQQFLETVK